MIIEFYIGEVVYLVEKLDNMQYLSSYTILGCGDLSMIKTSNKIGYGFSLEGGYQFKLKSDTILYFTYEEMLKYFIKINQYIEIINRNNNFNILFNENNII